MTQTGMDNGGEGVAAVPPVILVAPNVSERMGGEAIRALNVWRELDRLGVDVQQVTHERVRGELSAKYPHLRATFVTDSAWQRLAFRVPALRPLNRITFQWRAAVVARRLAAAKPGAVVHHTSPISPVLPMFRVGDGVPMVVGPINGNIAFPKPFRDREGWSERFKRLTHPAAQLFVRTFFRGKRRAAALLVAGGDRTERSLRLGGCRPSQFVPALDNGVTDAVLDRPPADPAANPPHFLHIGRFDPYKGADLAIRAIGRTTHPCELTLIGRGRAKADLERLVADLNLSDRVHFAGWLSPEQVTAALLGCRAMVFPSVADAGGTAIQESMAMGVPVVAVDYGGPGEYLTAEAGIPIPLGDASAVVSALVSAMDRLAADPELAGRLGRGARARAIAMGFRWSDQVRRWTDVYRRVGLSRPVY